MESSAFLAFDFSGIQQSCWKECDNHPASYLLDEDVHFPPYRDPNSEGQFRELAHFFGCVDVCEGGYANQRLAFILPLVGLGKLTLL